MALSSLRQITLVILPLFCGILTSEAAWDHNIAISLQDGHDNDSCLNSSLHCRTLDFVLKNLMNSTRVLLVPPPANESHFLKENCTNLTYYRNIAFIGNNSQVKVKCQNETGLSFHFSEGITFELLHFSKCGRLQYSPPFNNLSHSPLQFYAGIFLAYCRDLVVTKCVISGSSGIGLVLYDVGGNVTVTHSTFEKNFHQSNSNNNIYGGGGVSVQFTQYGALPPFEVNNTIHLNYTNNNMYYFGNCSFIENHFKKLKLNGTPKVPLPFGCGGGLSAFFRGSSQNNTMLIDSCAFQSNTAHWGAGMFVEFHDEAQGNHLQVNNCCFRNNNATYAGGGMRTGSSVNVHKQLRENKISYEEVHFINNSAILGGGLSHYGSTYLPTHKSERRNMSLTDCYFHDNKATMGSAFGVVLNNKNEFGIGPALPFRVVLESCEFVNNTVILTEDKVVVGQGAVYTSNVPLILKESNTFTNNSKTAMLLDNAIVKVYGNASFLRNAGINGGALALYGKAQIIMTYNSQMLFKENKAAAKGGAIYVRAPGPAVAAFETRQLRKHGCFLSYVDKSGHPVDIEEVKLWKTWLRFENNSAYNWSGDSLYATTLQACFKADEKRLNNTALIWSNVVHYSGNTCIGKEISTDPVKMNFEKEEWSVAPSEIFNASVKLFDEKNSPVYGIIRIDVKATKVKNVSLDLPSNLFLVEIDDNGQSMVRNLKLKGEENTDFTVEISNLDGQAIKNKSTEIRLCNCTPGYEQKGGSEKCVCSSPTERWKEGMSHCLADGKTVFLKSGYWGGKVDDNFVTYPCPPNYCSYPDQRDESMVSFQYNASTLCHGNRSDKSILCGKCKNDYTVNVGDEDCTPNSECAKHLAWQIPLFILGIPVIVLVVLRINIDIFTTYLNSWLYFYQVVPLLINEGAKFDTVLMGIISLANCRLPQVGTCFFRNIDNLSKFGLNYILPAYVLVLLIFIARTARCCRNCYVNNNVFRAVCTLLVLCYTNVTTISFNIIHAVNLGGRWVLYGDGNIAFDEPWSPVLIGLFTVAIVVIILFVLLVPLMLMCRGWFVHHFRFMNNFTPFIDIFQQCYRNGRGWFAAYYFLCRIALLIVDLYAFPGPFKRCLLENLTVLILLLCVLFKPYRTAQEHNDNNYMWLNAVDGVMLANLCVITIMCSAQNSNASHLTRKGLAYCVKILAWFPMLYLVGLIVYALKVYCLQRPARRKGYEHLEDPSSASGTSGHDPNTTTCG